MPLLDGDLQLGPGQMRPQAPVLAGAEGDVPVGTAVELHLVRLGEHLRSRVADWMDSSTMSSFLIGQP